MSSLFQSAHTMTSKFMPCYADAARWRDELNAATHDDGSERRKIFDHLILVGPVSKYFYFLNWFSFNALLWIIRVCWFLIHFGLNSKWLIAAKVVVSSAGDRNGFKDFQLQNGSPSLFQFNQSLCLWPIPTSHVCCKNY